MNNKTTFIRVEKNKNYTVIHNEFLRREDLSWKAKGMLAYILSLPDDWTINLDEIARHSTDGKPSFQSGWKELRDAGYVSRVPVKDNHSKKIIRWETIVRETADINKNHNPKTHSLETQSMENQSLENQPLLSTKELSTNKQSTKDNKEQSSVDDLSIPKRFEKIWKEYPNKKGKQKALSSYKRALKDNVTDEEILEGITRYKEHLRKNDWLHPAHGSTWFQQKRWDDEYESRDELSFGQSNSTDDYDPLSDVR